VQDFVRTYLARLRTALDRVDLAQVERVTDALIRARDERRSVFILGNGGSAARATHFASDLNKVASNGPARFRAISLTDNISLITAWANDEAFDQIFVRQLENLLDSGDVVMAFTCSGNSKNVVAAIEFARAQGATTLGVLGGDGGRLASLVDVSVRVEDDDYEIVEDGHAALCHSIVRFLADHAPPLPSLADQGRSEGGTPSV